MTLDLEVSYLNSLVSNRALSDFILVSPVNLLIKLKRLQSYRNFSMMDEEIRHS